MHDAALGRGEVLGLTSTPRSTWSSPTDAATVARRAGGRRAYNARRRFAAEARRAAVMALVEKEGVSIWRRGVQSKLAENLGVHRSTICRDVRIIKAEYRAACRCPLCGTEFIFRVGKRLGE